MRAIAGVDPHEAPDHGMRLARERQERKPVLAVNSFIDAEHVGPAAVVRKTHTGLHGEDRSLEVTIFPPSMRGTNEGHYAWDALPDTTTAGADQVASRMTNGTVATTRSGSSRPQVGTTMTNGTIQSASTGTRARQITVTYNGGKQTILVPTTAPVVAIEPADRSAVVAGARVFVRASETGCNTTADFLAVGTDGVIPPM